jgi:hypothetical protein
MSDIRCEIETCLILYERHLNHGGTCQPSTEVDLKCGRFSDIKNMVMIILQVGGASLLELNMPIIIVAVGYQNSTFSHGGNGSKSYAFVNRNIFPVLIVFTGFLAIGFCKLCAMFTLYTIC